MNNIFWKHDHTLPHPRSLREEAVAALELMQSEGLDGEEARALRDKLAEAETVALEVRLVASTVARR